ncbi:PREDICTED: dynein heavy chain 1, axonemal-like, partial [Priapulus caudatus]|uniref:Dynein heavy chain 1, axonemal-like n=1 Tax=Priapulus caudatus TaxID=37621 RepID=A0ABM1F6L1_PRICU
MLLAQTVPDLLRLWYHENCRVFQDRLINGEDRDWFENLLRAKMDSDFSTDYQDVVTTSPVLYGDFMNTTAEKKIYNEIADHKK